MGQQTARLCPECGAPTVQGMTCWEQLGGIIAWEYQDSDLMAEHFLTVATYNLQHPAQFTDAAIAGLRTSLIEHVDKGTAVSYIRQRSAAANDGKKRVLKPESERHPVLRHWKMTIADVYLPHQPQGAADRVRAWAAATRSQLEGPNAPETPC